MSGSTLLSDDGHLLLWCDCPDCGTERAWKECTFWFQREDSMPDHARRRIESLHGRKEEAHAQRR